MIYFPHVIYAATTIESCTTGIYANSYAPSCNSCGYETMHYYINTSFDIWDWYHNNGTEKVISSSSS